MSEPELELPTDLENFHGDTLLMHAELLELELYKIRREMFADPGAVKVNIGAGQPTEQTVPGNQQDPYNGVAIFNPTSATISVGFQTGAGYLAPAIVPPFSWAAFSERYTNLSLALLNPADQQLAITDPVTVLRTRVPPTPAAGPYGLQEAWPELELNIAGTPAGAEWSVTVPAGQWWKLETLAFSLTTSATAGNRFAQVQFLDAGGNLRYRCGVASNMNVGASSTGNYAGARLGPVVQLANSLDFFLPDLWIPPGYTIASLTSGLAGGGTPDQYQTVRGIYRMATRQPR